MSADSMADSEPPAYSSGRQRSRQRPPAARQAAARDAYGRRSNGSASNWSSPGTTSICQRSKSIDAVTYIVSGAAAESRRGRASFTAESWSVRHLVDVATWCHRLEVRAVAQDVVGYDHAVLDDPTGEAPSAPASGTSCVQHVS